MADFERDELGCLVLGNPARGCEFCGAEAEPTYSGCGKAVWWHPPLACCDERKRHQRKADALAAAEEAREHAARGWVP